MEPSADKRGETYNPWSVVNLVFHHLAAQGLHPILGEAGDPAPAAAELLRALGIQPSAGASSRLSEDIRRQLTDLRSAAFGDG